MAAGPSALVALRETLGIEPSPRWSVERALIDTALRDGRYGSDAARRILRGARERAAWQNPHFITEGSRHSLLRNDGGPDPPSDSGAADGD